MFFTMIVNQSVKTTNCTQPPPVVLGRFSDWSETNPQKNRLSHSHERANPRFYVLCDSRVVIPVMTGFPLKTHKSPPVQSPFSWFFLDNRGKCFGTFYEDNCVRQCENASGHDEARFLRPPECADRFGRNHQRRWPTNRRFTTRPAPPRVASNAAAANIPPQDLSVSLALTIRQCRRCFLPGPARSLNGSGDSHKRDDHRR